MEGHPDEAGVDAFSDCRARLQLATPGDEPHPVPLLDAERLGVFRVYLDEGILLLLDDALLAHRHRRRVVVVERAPGRQDERILGVRLLDGWLVLDRIELPLAVRPRRRGRVEIGRSRVVAIEARPLEADLLDTVVADA